MLDELRLAVDEILAAIFELAARQGKRRDDAADDDTSKAASLHGAES
jgi:hypothetical protein